ncbi:uncharacterized protein NPIL_344781 [Nephila pilipes]|uniref:Uncharacterized protein n=1 Tax=Nephila pilipes TaxID=299642 RepID=A0A8X6MSQ8_NEPPI|nr:uncharacterized protein NPIL_344781 [Nephila pilipes]
MLFAEDLMEFTLAQFGVNWVEKETGIRRFRSRIQKQLFRPQIGMAVCDLIATHSEVIIKCYKDLILRGMNCVEDFKYEATITTIYYLSNGLSCIKYLQLCALFSGITYQCFRNNDCSLARDIASASSQLLAYVANYFIYEIFFIPNEFWFEFFLVAQAVRRRIWNGTLYANWNEFRDIELPYFDMF